MSLESPELNRKFENQETEIDIESLLENAEIVNSYALEGDHGRMRIIEFQGGQRAIFRPELASAESNQQEVADPNELLARFKEKLRGDLEILSFRLDKILGFDIVPAVVRREVEGQKGVAQHYIETARPAKIFGKAWDELVEDQELLKAAVFDYLINAKDRNTGNFLVDPLSKKVWLIDNDFFMMMNPFGIPSDIRFRAERRNLSDITPELAMSLGHLVSGIEVIKNELSPELSEELEAIKQRAIILMSDKKLPLQEYLA